MKGHMQDGKFHPHIDYKKGIRKSRDQKTKTQGVIRKQRNVLSKHITASSKVVGKNIFFNQADMDVVPYKFRWNGEVIYPHGFEKDILINLFGLKKLTDAEITKVKRGGHAVGIQADWDGTNQEFLESLIESRGESWLLDFPNPFGSLETNPDFVGDEENKEYVLLKSKDELRLYDVTDIGEEEGLTEISRYLYPQLDFWFTVNGKSFSVDYTGQRDYEFNPLGFDNSGTDAETKAVEAKLEDKVFEEREKFTRKQGVQ